MAERFLDHLRTELDEIRRAGLYKDERVLTTPQGPWVEADGQRALNLCANNYLGLANDPTLVEAARSALTRYGYGTASVRFICGTQDLHRDLERRLAAFLGVEDAILYSSCFDANGGVFEALLGPDDAIVSDTLNHASLIDGIRLCKARRFRYDHDDMSSLAARLEEAADARFRLIATDGVFSMDGTIADLPAICDLADRHDAVVLVDDCHATGFMGSRGRGTHELLGVDARVHILTGTLGKALGGASGGYVAGRREIVEILRQRSRPYLFSNALVPMIAATSLEVLRLVEEGDDLRRRLWDNTAYFRGALEALGFKLRPGRHAIIPVLLGSATLAVEMARRLLDEGVFVVAFSYPVVPRDQARIRTQMSAAHTREDLEMAVDAFERVGRRLQIIGA